jgi:hypothetical protein
MQPIEESGFRSLRLSPGPVSETPPEESSMKNSANLGKRLLNASASVAMIAACNSAPIPKGNEDSATSITLKKQQSTGDKISSEGDTTDLPQEITGAFLTCNYVTSEEGGFPPSPDHVPVGCMIELNGRKLSEDTYESKIGLYSSAKQPDFLATRKASAKSKWHGFGHLPRAGQTEKLLGMTITNKDSDETYGPLYFPVNRLGVESDEALFNLVGGYVTSGGANLDSGVADFFASRNVSPENTPILPEAYCDAGRIRAQWDPQQYDDVRAKIGGVTGLILRDLKIVRDDVVADPNLTKPESIKPTRDITCFILAKLAAKDDLVKILKTEPVLEGGGCFLLQSKQEGTIVFDRPSIARFNISKKYLQTYVLSHLCP